MPVPKAKTNGLQGIFGTGVDKRVSTSVDKCVDKCVGEGFLAVAIAAITTGDARHKTYHSVFCVGTTINYTRFEA